MSHKPSQTHRHWDYAGIHILRHHNKTIEKIAQPLANYLHVFTERPLLLSLAVCENKQPSRIAKSVCVYGTVRFHKHDTVFFMEIEFSLENRTGYARDLLEMYPAHNRVLSQVACLWRSHQLSRFKRAAFLQVFK